LSGWEIGIVAYSACALITFIPVLRAMLAPVRLHDGGPGFEQVLGLGDDAKARLIQNYERIQGTLGFWKQRATLYGRLHYYSVIWSILASVAVPVLTQALPANDSAAKWLLTLISGHAAILITANRGLNVTQNYQAFRQGESDFYDLYRRLLDRPDSFRGVTEQERLADYFERVEAIRRAVRNAETDNLPAIAETPAPRGAVEGGTTPSASSSE
jgi:hypothetical protein